MPQKSKGGNKSRSVVSGKRKRTDMKHHKKDNYKKKKEKKIECSVCYDEVSDRSDNVIMCGKTKHPLCGPCKMKMLGTGSECPMCRSHPIPEPKNQEVEIRIKKQKTNEEKESKKIKVKGLVDCLDGIYLEIGKDKKKYSIYKLVNDDGSPYDWYIYRSKKNEWVLNNSYDPKDDCLAAYSLTVPKKHQVWGNSLNYSGKFIGTSDWYVPSEINDGDWDITTVKIIKIN